MTQKAPAALVDATKEYQLLLDAFESFTRASGQLEQSHRELQKQTLSLQLELEQKNKELEINLAEKERVRNYLNHILQSLPCGVVVVDADGAVTLANQQAMRLIGSRNGDMAALGQFAAGRHDGEQEITIEGDDAPLHLLVRSSTLLSPGKAAAERTLILTDVTRMKRLEEEGRRGERLRTMGEMSCQLAHEIRNPLGAIEIYSSLLEKETTPETESRRWATSILTSARCLNNTLTNMLSFPKIMSPRSERVDLTPLIDECAKFVGPVMSQRAVVSRLGFRAGSSVVCGDPDLLRQMFINLIFNAVQAMPRGGTLTIDVEDAQPGEPRMVLIQVTDTGRGIPPENLPRIFDPFFTTNRNGTGLGLSIVHTIVQRHDGTIDVESHQGVGTTFRIQLPAAQREG